MDFTEFITKIKNNWDIIWDIIIFILPLIWGIIEFFKRKINEIEIEKLKKELELGNQQKLQNDKVFRENYQIFINLMVDKVMENKPNEVKKDKTVKGMIEFIKSTLIFAGPKTIKSFGEYMKNAGKTNNNQIIFDMENLIFSMRNDLKVDNIGLKKGDILQTFINEDINNLLTSNPTPPGQKN